jgi:major membrane immunogen (membrane-anchored lipoprotein)
MARLTLVLLVVAALLSGCGAANKAGQSANTGGATGTRGELFGDDATVEGQTAAFRAGKIYCGLYPLDELARQEGVKAKAEAVAKSYSQAEATPKDKEEAYKGCLAALKQPGSG